MRVQELESSHNHFEELEAALGMALESVESSAEEASLLEQHEQSIAQLRDNIKARDARVADLERMLAAVQDQTLPTEELARYAARAKVPLSLSLLPVSLLAAA